ncbi:hypothetical protein BDN72DRAFT_105262 [Pluteus cervinus]|uniref:Uncharacterized protein n=1 Tax=Pluteus cervinus TaxID=181527 RepID=A0ACD3ANJ2_9AGAR|nr:hypothetical protein BDN72DRAFT_105262 [Pluteus cervinus]
MFQQIPLELKEIILHFLPSGDLINLATLCRDFHHLALFHFFERNHVFESNNRVSIYIDTALTTKIDSDTSSDKTITEPSNWTPIPGSTDADAAALIFRALLLALLTALPCTPKVLSCTFWRKGSLAVYDPYEYAFFESLNYIKHLVEKFDSMAGGFEEVILDFRCFKAKWLYLPQLPSPFSLPLSAAEANVCIVEPKTPRDIPMIPLHELLDFITFKSRCRRLNVSNGHPFLPLNWSVPRSAIRAALRAEDGSSKSWRQPLTRLSSSWRKGQDPAVPIQSNLGSNSSLDLRDGKSRKLKGNSHRECKTGAGETSGLRVLHLHSSFPFHITFIPVWTLKLLSSSDNGHASPSGIEVLSFKDTRRSADDWALILSYIHLPRLRELYLNDSSIGDKDLTEFLSRHPNLVHLDVGYASGYDSPSSSDGTASSWSLPLGRVSSRPLLPHVESFAGIPALIDSYLGQRNIFIHTQPLPSLQSLTINVTHYSNNRFFISGINIGLSSPRVVQRIEKLSAVSLRISVHKPLRTTAGTRHGLTEHEWLKVNEREDPSDAHPIQDYVTTLVLVSQDESLFLATEHAGPLLPAWLNRFPKVEKVVIETGDASVCILEATRNAALNGLRGHGNSRRMDVDWVKKLASGILQETKVRILEVNGKAKTLGEWVSLSSGD